MARPARKTRAVANRGRRTGKRPVKVRVVFAVEGESEKSYLQALLRVRYDEHFTFVFWNKRDQPSLKNLVEVCRRHQADGEDPGAGIWIVGDTDRNLDHRPQLEDWLGAAPHLAHAALTDPCLELWLLLHYADPKAAYDAHGAAKELQKHLPGYAKGRPLPSDLINRTDDALRRMAARGTSSGTDGCWPGPRVSQLPELIRWLDGLIPARGG